jgi:hypothetical protein
MTEAEFMALKSRPKMTETDFMDTCVIMSQNGIGSLKELLEMPSDEWFEAQKALGRVIEKQNEAMKHGH